MKCLKYGVEGIRFYSEAKRILMEIEEIPRIAEDIRLNKGKKLNIVAPSYMVMSSIPEAINVFSGSHPDIRYSLGILARNELGRFIVNEQFDIGFAALPIDIAMIKMENGATIYLESAWALNIVEAAEAEVTLCGTAAGADMNEGLKINKADLNRLVVTQALNPNPTNVFDNPPADKPGTLFIRDWIDCIRNDTDPVVKPEQALVVTQLLEAIYESAKTGKAVYLS